MCGIAGKISFRQPIARADLVKMASAIAHRGPDDEGIYVSANKRVGLCHRRLAIIDLSPLGHQPMSYLDRYTIVFNGEIYNHADLRARLEKLGYSFRSRSDTEVILALWAHYKEKCLLHLRGMFAFAIYDHQDNKLFCARDRIGKKPFKYYLDDSVFLFASELKAILTQKEYQRAPDHEAIFHYLTLQYVPAPLTGFKAIRKLEPGSSLTLDVTSGVCRVTRYWKPDFSRQLDVSQDEWVERVKGVLDEAVALRLVSDVPVGAFLSGGIDSSLVVALMAKHAAAPIQTFSIGFNEASHNELGYAKLVADRFATNHTEQVIDVDAISVLPELVEMYEEPYADSSALPSYYISRLARQNVKVVVTGDGGDENFAGYQRYSYFKLALASRGLAPLLSIGPSQLIGWLRRHKGGLSLDRLERFVTSLNLSPAATMTNYTAFFTPSQKMSLLTAQFQAAWRPTEELMAEVFNSAGSADWFDQVLYADLTTYLPEDLLAKIDIASMAVGLEARSPLLDHKLIELTCQMPHQLKLKGLSQKKYLLKRVASGLIPEPIIHRPKRGFSLPLAAWFRGKLGDYAKQRLLDSSFARRRVVLPKQVERLLAEHQSGKNDHAHKLWALTTLALWYDCWFKVK